MFLSSSPTLMFCPRKNLHLSQRLLQNCALLWGVIDHKFNFPNVSKIKVDPPFTLLARCSNTTFNNYPKGCLILVGIPTVVARTQLDSFRPIVGRQFLGRHFWLVLPQNQLIH